MVHLITAVALGCLQDHSALVTESIPTHFSPAVVSISRVG